MEMDMHVYVEVECTKQCQFDVTEYNQTCACGHLY